MVDKYIKTNTHEIPVAHEHCCRASQPMDSAQFTIISTVCRRLWLQQRPSLNLNVNCLTLICRPFKCIILMVRPRLVVHKWLLILPCTYHKLECVFQCLLLLFLRASAMLKHVIDIGWTSVRLSVRLSVRHTLAPYQNG